MTNSIRFFTISFILSSLSFTPVFSQSNPLTDLSTGCQGAASSLLTGGLATCAAIPSLISLATAQGSIVQPLDGWLQKMCVQTCAPSDLQTAASSIQSGCSTDLASGNPIAEALILFTSNYTAVQSFLCEEQQSNNSLCITTFLNNVQTATGQQLGLSTISALFGNTTELAGLFNSLPTSEICSDCDKAIITKAKPFFSAAEASSLQSAVSGKCPSNFLDGTIPSDIVQLSNSTAPGSNSGSSKSDSTGLKVTFGVLLAAVSGASLIL